MLHIVTKRNINSPRSCNSSYLPFLLSGYYYIITKLLHTSEDHDLGVLERCSCFSDPRSYVVWSARSWQDLGENGTYHYSRWGLRGQTQGLLEESCIPAGLGASKEALEWPGASGLRKGRPDPSCLARCRCYMHQEKHYRHAYYHHHQNIIDVS